MSTGPDHASGKMSASRWATNQLLSGASALSEAFPRVRLRFRLVRRPKLVSQVSAISQDEQKGGEVLG
jgi:hypothetical protein